MVAHIVRKNGYPNRFGARIPVKSKWNLERLEQLLQGYEDKEIIEWIRFGWPTGRLPTLPPPAQTFKKSQRGDRSPRITTEIYQQRDQQKKR